MFGKHFSPGQATTQPVVVFFLLYVLVLLANRTPQKPIVGDSQLLHP